MTATLQRFHEPRREADENLLAMSTILSHAGTAKLLVRRVAQRTPLRRFLPCPS